MKKLERSLTILALRRTEVYLRFKNILRILMLFNIKGYMFPQSNPTLTYLTFKGMYIYDKEKS